MDRRAALKLGVASVLTLRPQTDLEATAKTSDPKVARIAYGEREEQFGDLWLPGVPRDAPLPVVALLHGGFWQHEYDLRLMDSIAAAVTAHGCACWNIEYRRVGSKDGGGFPDTFADVSAAVEWVGSPSARDMNLDARRLVVAGHSAGGTLAMWLALQPLLPATCGFGAPAVRPRAAVSLGGVLDLAWAEQQRQGGSAVDELMGAPPPYPCSSPIEMLPSVSASLRASSGRQLQQPDCLLGLVHAVGDRVVPVAQSIRFTVAACTAGFEVELNEVRNDDHFSCLDPRSASWQAASSILHRGIAGDVPHYTSSSQDMLPTLREETPTSVIIRTRRATP